MRKIMKIVYCSDLHLEFQVHVPVNCWPDGDICVLAGDIFTANFLNLRRTDNPSLKMQAKFLRLGEQLKKYEKVIWIPGNHEYYNGSWNNTIPTMKAFCKKHLPNFIIMENDTFVYNEVRFIATTLWTDMKNGDPLFMYDVSFFMNDYKCVLNEDTQRLLSPETTLQRHHLSKEYISKILEQSKEKKNVVVTHHPATLSALNRSHSGNGLDGAFASDMDQFIIDRPNINYWISGHTHMPLDISVGSCKMLSNPRCYQHEYFFKTFKPKVFTV